MNEILTGAARVIGYTAAIVCMAGGLTILIAIVSYWISKYYEKS